MEEKLDAAAVAEASKARFQKRLGIINQRYDAETMPMVEHNDGKLYPPHEGQVRMWNSTKQIVAVTKGWRAGGSYYGSPWLLREIQRAGPGDYMLMAPTDRLLDGAARPYFYKFFDNEPAGRKFGTYNVSRFLFEFNTAGVVKLFGEDVGPVRVIMIHSQNKDAVEAYTIKAFWGDEAGQYEDEIWEAIQARCLVNGGRMLLTSRPYYENFFKREIWDKCPNPTQPDYPDNPFMEVVHFPSSANPNIPKEALERQIAQMQKWRADMKYGALFTRPGGAVYEDWDEDWGKVEPFMIPAHWKRHFGVDFGGSNTAVVKCATDPDTGIDYWYEEYEGGNKPSWLHVKEVLRNELRKSEIRVTGGAPSEDGYRAEWTTAGLHVQKPHVSSVEIGIDRVQAYIKGRQFRVFSTCPQILNYLGNYSWKVDDEGNAIPGQISDKHKWHVGDGFRYKVAHFDAPGETEVKQYSGLGEEESQDDGMFSISTWSF